MDNKLITSQRRPTIIIENTWNIINYHSVVVNCRKTEIVPPEGPGTPQKNSQPLSAPMVQPLGTSLFSSFQYLLYHDNLTITV